MELSTIELVPLPHSPGAGIFLQSQAIEQGLVRYYEQTAEQFYQRTQSQSPEIIQKSLPAGQKYVPTASSFTLEAVFNPEDCRRILRAIAASSARQFIERTLAGPPLCDLDQSWVRRQYAPGRCPPLHAPHAWHQDGALRHDFKTQAPTAPGENGLLPMLTCWLPLVPCGDDAPGLEFIAVPINELQSPDSLTDQSLRSSHPAEKFSKPLMQPGDVLLFRSGVIHRTHVTPAMQSDRTSIELRFVAANRIPPRLAHDRFTPLDRLRQFFPRFPRGFMFLFGPKVSTKALIMGQLVVAGAMMTCSFGVAPAALAVLPLNKTMAGTPAANIMDFKPMVNIPTFGMCSSIANPTVASATAAALGVLTPMPCIPVTTAPWAPGSPTVMIANQPALNNSSTCMCNWAGVISFTSAGQVKTMVP